MSARVTFEIHNNLKKSTIGLGEKIAIRNSYFFLFILQKFDILNKQREQ